MQVPKGLGTIADLDKRYKAAESRFQLWRSIHQECFDFAAPERETFHMRSPGQRKNRHIFDSTAVIGLQRFANRLQGSMVPAWMEWMEYTAGSEIPEEERDDVNKKLEKSTKSFFAAINHSNFSTEITPAFSDLGIGTGAIMVEEGAFQDTGDLLRFTNVPLAEFYPEAPVNGIIESSWRKQEIEPRNIKRTWPDAELPESLMKLIKNKPDAKVDIQNGMVFNPDDKQYHQCVLYKKTLIFTQAFKTKRLIAFRWHVTPGETYGRGPIMQVLADIRTANKVKQFMLENAAIQMSGIYTGMDDGIFNPHTARIAPGVILPVGSNAGANPSLTPITPSGNLGLGDLILGDLQENIEKVLLSNPLGDMTDPVRTATENIIRQQESLKNEGASFGRLKSELIEPLVEAVTEILVARGKIAQFKVDGQEVTVKQSSPLAKAEAIEDFQNSQLWWQSVQTLPEELVMGSVKVENLPKYWADKLGVPADLSRTEEERASFAEQALEASQQMVEQGAEVPQAAA